MPARDLLCQGSPLATALPGYEARPEQLLMADAVESALDGGTGALVEAGTGTGKSLAYLVPAAMSSLRVVISTATKALGEQLMEKDIPTLKRLGLHPDVTLVKGLSNYVCRRRLEEYRQGVATGAMAPEYGLDRVLDWVEDTASGDRAELPSLAEDAAVWREVVSSSETRIGPKCRFYDQCFVTRMRRAAEASQLIVTNHHMFCADLALRGGFSGRRRSPTTTRSSSTRPTPSRTWRRSSSACGSPGRASTPSRATPTAPCAPRASSSTPRASARSRPPSTP
jgi:ATP-dependent DNA helicase DinG